MIQTTGKYLNVMRESGCPVQLKDEKGNIDYKLNESTLFASSFKYTRIQHDSSYKLTTHELGAQIHGAYNLASKALLELLMNKQRILERFALVSYI